MDNHILGFFQGKVYWKNHGNEGSLDGKRKLVGSIFPQKFVFENEKIRTTDLNPVLLKITSVNRCLQRGKKKRQTKNHDLSLKVENSGFEPLTSCLPGKRSSQLS